MFSDSNGKLDAQSGENAVKIGYYRWTDIYYSWSQSLSDDPYIQSVMKSLLNPVAMANPDHPLRKGKEGVQLFQGTLQNHFMRLLFDSKQVEYLRYWLQEMGFTGGKTLSIPNSNYLLTLGNELRAISPVIYTSVKQMKDAHKIYEKHNRRMKMMEGELLVLRQNFECIRNCWDAKIGNWCAMDFESWEIDHRLVTEVGYSRVWWENGEEKSEVKHIIIKENSHLINHQYVAGNRDRYLFGQSEKVPLGQAKESVKEMLGRWREEGPLFLVFHGRAEDMRLLQKWDVPIDNSSDDIPAIIPSDGLYIIDTAEMFRALQGNLAKSRTLEIMSRLLHIPGVACFHNAGNDAHFTMLSLKDMAGGMPLDAQREARWPGQSVGSFKVDFRQHQLDNDYDDMEGVMRLEDESDPDSSGDEFEPAKE